MASVPLVDVKLRRRAFWAIFFIMQKVGVGVFSVLLFSLSLSGCVTRAPAVVAGGAPGGVAEAAIGDTKLVWRFEDERIYVELGAPTNGWLGIAIEPAGGRGPAAVGKAQVIAGYIDEGRVVVRDDYGCESYAHCADVRLGGTDDLQDVAGEESLGWTEVRFSLPQRAADPYDVSIRPGEEYVVIVGYGMLDRLESNHFARYRIRITL